MTLHSIGRKAPILLLAAAIVAAGVSTQTALASRGPRRIDLSSRVGMASQLKNGRVLTFGNGYRVQEYTVDGELIRSIVTVGSTGRWLGTCGTTDEAFVVDGKKSALIRIADGEAFTTPIQNGFRPDKAACANPTTLVLADWPKEALDPKTPYGAYRSKELLPVRLNGREIGRYKSDERFRYAKTDGPRPLGRQLLIAANTSRLFVGNNDTFTIDIYDLNGNKVGQINRPADPRPFTEADRKAYVEDWGNRTGRLVTDTALWRQILPAATFPAYDRLLTTTQGVWVQEPSVTDSVKTWRVFDNNGAYVKTVTVPATYELMQVSGGQMFGAWVKGGTKSVTTSTFGF